MSGPNFSTPETPTPERPSKLDRVPAAVILAFFILVGCAVTVLGMVVLGYAPVTSMVLGMVLLACAFSMLSGSPISLALIAMTGFLVIVSSMVMVREVPEMRTGAQISAVIFAVVMALALSQFRWFFRAPQSSGRKRP